MPKVLVYVIYNNGPNWEQYDQNHYDKIVGKNIELYFDHIHVISENIVVIYE